MVASTSTIDCQAGDILHLGADCQFNIADAGSGVGYLSGPAPIQVLSPESLAGSKSPSDDIIPGVLEPLGFGTVTLKFEEPGEYVLRGFATGFGSDAAGVVDVTINVKPAPVVRTAPYDFVTELNGLVNCNSTATTGTGQARTQSNPQTGGLSLDIKARSSSGSAIGRAGVGVRYSAPASGTVRIAGQVVVNGFDEVSLVAIPKLGTTGIASIESAVEISVKRLRPGQPALDVTAPNNFAARILTPGLLPTPGSPIDLVKYTGQSFTSSVDLQVLPGDQLLICVGTRSHAVAVALLPWVSTAKAFYERFQSSGQTRVTQISVAYV